MKVEVVVAVLFVVLLSCSCDPCEDGNNLIFFFSISLSLPVFPLPFLLYSFVSFFLSL